MISVILRTSEFRGDHSADVLIAYELEPEETVEHLAKRLLIRDAEGDCIEVRFAVPPPALPP
jgi:hypothetical protein